MEHPAGSRAWNAFGLPAPMAEGWWRDVTGGWCARVEQGHFGHRTRKATWLYYVGASAPPPLPRGASRPDGYVPGRRGGEVYTRLSVKQRAATPVAFRDLLLAIARGAR